VTDVTDDVLGRLRKARGFIFDMDGTLVLGDRVNHGLRPLPGAIAMLEWARSRGRAYLVFTNGTNRTPADFAHFKAASEALAKQYDQYAPFPEVHLNGHQTLDENIADVAGISAALDGYHASLGGKPAPEYEGFTGDQQLFIAFAQNWASKTRDAALRSQIATDVHAPGHWRSFEVRNIDAWYNAFGVTSDQKLYLPSDQRVRIW